MLQRKIGLCVLRERDSHGDDQDPFRIMNGMEGGSYGILRYFLDQKFRVDRSISKRFFISNQGNLSPKTGKLLIAQFFFPNLPPTIDPLTSFYGRAGGQITFNLPKNHFFSLRRWRHAKLHSPRLQYLQPSLNYSSVSQPSTPSHRSSTMRAKENFS